MAEETILIVDDESAIRDVIRMALELAGYNCLEAADAQAAHAAIVDHGPDLVLLDWMMPQTSGIELLRRLRKEDIARNLPVIMLTAKDGEDSRVQGLDVGADDYMCKPFSNKELLARIRALLRRSGTGNLTEMIEMHGLQLDTSAKRVFADAVALKLKPIEYRLLHFFMTNPERAWSRGQLLDQVWGGNVYVEDRTVDVHIRRLRKALNTKVGDYGDLIQTVRGTGYRFSAVPAGE